MKKKGKGLVLSILAAVFSVLSFLGFAFSGLTLMGIGEKVEFRSMSFKEWDQYRELFKDAEGNIGIGVTLWTVAKVLMIVVLVLAVAVAALAVLQLFFEHKAIKTAAKVVNIVAIILAILLPMVQSMGGALISMELMMGSSSGLMFLAGSGVFVMALFTLLGAAFSLGANKKPKAKKEA